MSIASIVLLLSIASSASAAELASLAIDCDRRFEVDITLTNDTTGDVPPVAEPAPLEPVVPVLARQGVRHVRREGQRADGRLPAGDLSR